MQLDSSAFVADPELTNALRQRATPIQCETDRLLFRQEDPATGVYIVEQGSVTITMSSHDGRTIFSLETAPGSLLGLPAVVSDHSYSLSAVARAGAQVTYISRSDFLEMMQAQPALSLKMLQVLAAEVRTARQALF